MEALPEDGNRYVIEVEAASMSDEFFPAGASVSTSEIIEQLNNGKTIYVHGLIEDEERYLAMTELVLTGEDVSTMYFHGNGYILL